LGESGRSQLTRLLLKTGQETQILVTSPLTGEGAESADVSSRSRRLADAAGPKQVSLVWQRILRGARRQLSAFVLSTTLVTGVALLYEYADNVSPFAALPICLAIGVTASLLLTALFEFGRNTITSVSSLGKKRGYVVLGAAPELSPQALRELPPDWRSPLGCLAFQPASSFATAFRDLQGAIARDRLVAFIGPIPNDGATTAALGAAVSATQQGRKVLLVDCDLRRRSLTRSLVGEVSAGVLEAANRPRNWPDLVIQEPETGLHILPAALLKNPWATLVDAGGFTTLVDQLQRAYDLVIFDCPPALGSAEGAALARGADTCVLVVAWDDTSISTLREAVRALRRTGKPTIYVNRVPRGYRFGRLRPD
jgi:Mrp family chromosome partitioning ATPase